MSWNTPETVRSLDLGTARLSYRVVGAGPALVVVPGGPGFGCDYLRAPLLRLLGAGRRLVFHDPRGCGASTGHEQPQQLTMENLVGDLEALRGALAIERLDVLGHSFGGLLALHYALRCPKRTRSLILVDADPARWEDWNDFGQVLEGRRTAEDSRRLDAIQNEPGWERDSAEVTEYYRILLRPYFVNPELAHTLDFGFGAASLEKFRVTFGAIRHNLGRWDLMEDLRGLRVPTLLLYGEQNIFPLAALESMVAALPCAELKIVPSAGHFPFLETPEAFRALVVDFLERVNRTVR